VALSKPFAYDGFGNRNKWLQTMQKFATFVGNIRQLQQTDENIRERQSGDEIQVAVLDDGIDWSFAYELGCKGRSFYADKRSDFDGQKVWYSSSGDHGTLMTALIRKICPNVYFHVARLDQTESEPGIFQPTPESAAKVSTSSLPIKSKPSDR
jgi:hypothetical protein